MVENKMRHPEERWKNVPVILTCNKLPFVMIKPYRSDKETDQQFQDREYNYMAFMTRCKITKIKQSHKNCEQFPYTADQLAQYMQLLCNTVKPIIEDELPIEKNE